MYVCHHCGYISHNDNVNYCNNVNCKYYGYNDSDANKSMDCKFAESQKPQPTDTNESKTIQKRSLMKMDSMTYNYEGDINYPSDKRMNSMDGMSYSKNTNNTNNMNNMSNMGSMSYDKRMDGSMDYDKRMNNMDGMSYSKNTEGMNRMEMKDMRDKAYKADEACGSLAFAAVPMQKPENLYMPKEAMRAGTLFPSLNMPYDKKIIWRG